MKKISVYTVMLILALLSACSQITGPEIDSEETMNNMKALVKENVTDKGMRLISLSITPREALTNKPDLIYLIVADKENALRSMTFLWDMGKYGLTKEGELERMGGHENGEGVPTLDIDNLSAELIQKQVAEAKTQIPEGYEFEGVGYYSITSLNGKPVTDFKIQITESGNSKKITGRRIETTYYELECKVDEDGKVIVKLEEE